MRTAFVMAAVTPEERTAAASFTTAVPRSLAAALGPGIGVPLVLCGGLKIGYDLALWRACRGVRMPGS